MPRAIWSGAISFGLVNAPVRMYTAIAEHNVHFHLLHEPDASPIHYRKVCEKQGKEVPDDEIVKGYEVDEGEYVFLDDDDFAAAQLERNRLIEIHDFVAADSIDPIAFERSYYLGPDEGSERVYGLLVRALEKAGLVGIASFVFHDRDQLACLRVRDRVLLLERMYFADEIRPSDAVVPDRTPKIPERELKLAVDLIERMKGKFDHDAYHDQYRERLLEVIARKRKGETISVPEAPAASGPADLLSALEESLAAAKGRNRTRENAKPKAKPKAKAKAKAKPRRPRRKPAAK